MGVHAKVFWRPLAAPGFRGRPGGVCKTSTVNNIATTETDRAKVAAQTLRYLEFKGLFGALDREIFMERDAPTIITGANGTGKSTVLRLINAAANGMMRTLATAPLDYFRLAFDRGPDFVLERGDAGIKLTWGDESLAVGQDDPFTSLPLWAADAFENVEFDGNRLARELMDFAQANGVPADEYRRVRSLLLHADDLDSLLRAPLWMNRFGQGFPVLFVADQRLITEPSGSANRGGRSNKTSRLAIEAASADLGERLRAADSDYARSSQIADGNLAEALIQRMSTGWDVPSDDVQGLIQRVDERRDVLRAVGLLDESSAAGVAVDVQQLGDPAVRRVVQVVMESSLAKFKVLEDLEGRLTAFKRFIDGRLAFKQLTLDRKFGMRFDLPNDRSVSPRELSSGEQQITVLAYEVLFRSQPSTLVIVDEPEISLHVTWQDSLVADLQTMGRASDVQFLLATHSPMILAGHPELERSLSVDDRDA